MDNSGTLAYAQKKLLIVGHCEMAHPYILIHLKTNHSKGLGIIPIQWKTAHMKIEASKLGMGKIWTGLGKVTYDINALLY